MRTLNFTGSPFFDRIPRVIRYACVIAVTLGLLLRSDIASAEEHGAHDAHKMQHTADLNVTLHTDPQIVQAGTSTALTFHLTDGAGESVSDLLVHHARVLHVIVASENLQILGHIHPEDFENRDILAELDGRYTVHFTFPAAGRYILAVDVMTADAEFAKHLYVDVVGTVKLSDLVQDLHREKAVLSYTDEGGDRYTKAMSLNEGAPEWGYHAKIAAPDPIKAGEQVQITYHFSRKGEPLTDLVPFLDAPMHFAIVSSRLDGIVHTHGIIPGSEKMDKSGMTDPHAGHQMVKPETPGHQHQGVLLEQFGPELLLMTTFPEPGIYQIFGQLKHGDQILCPSFMVEVVE